MAHALINVPKRTLHAGEVFEIRVLIQHPMENGQRRDAFGHAIPRDIVHSFTCTYDGEEVLSVDLQPAIAANPFLAFSAVARASGTIELAWTDDHGETTVERVPVTVA